MASGVGKPALRLMPAFSSTEWGKLDMELKGGVRTDTSDGGWIFGVLRMVLSSLSFLATNFANDRIRTMS